jgi:hypothetical protein
LFKNGVISVKLRSSKVSFFALLFVLNSCTTPPTPPEQVEQKLDIQTKYETNAIITYETETLDADYLKLFCNNLDVDSSQCIDNIKDIQKVSGFEGFDLSKHPIANNPLGIKKVDAIKVRYHTGGVFGDDRTVSGTFLIPQLEEQKLRGVVLFFHPTLLSKYNVPSSDADNHILKLLAEIFASQGYIVATPDYIGMGDDAEIPHPYILYPRVNTDDGLSILKTLRTYLNDQKRISKEQQLKLFVSSYSEGGGYALWFSRLAQDQKNGYGSDLSLNHYKLLHTAGISGAYNYSQIGSEWFFSTTTAEDTKYNISSTLLATGSKAGLIANAMISYGYYHENARTDDDYKKLFNPDFFDMKCSTFVFGCTVKGEQYNLLTVFAARAKEPEIGLAIFNSARGKSSNDVTYRILPTISNNGLALLSNDFFKDPLKKEKFHAFLEKADVDSWRTNSPVTFVYLKQDSIVTNLHSKKAYKNLHLLNSSRDVDFVEFDTDLLAGVKPKVDHVKGMDYLMIPALLKFNQYE